MVFMNVALDSELVSIKVKASTKRLIEAAKVHPRETIDDVLSRLLAKKNGKK